MTSETHAMACMGLLSELLATLSENGVLSGADNLGIVNRAASSLRRLGQAEAAQLILLMMKG